MTLTRREFLRTSAATGAAVGLSSTLAGVLVNPGHLLATDAIYLAEPARQPIKLLILGGTAFLGPAIVNAAVARGHTITLFNRGKTNPQLYPELEKLRGDRNGDLEALAGRQWDAVIDTSGYYPRVVKMSAELLAPNVGHYTFISSISVYRDFKTPDMTEAAPVGTIDDPTIEEITGETYGPLKALCEQAAEAAMPGRVANIRPGLIVGPRDRSDRFTYWPVRIARGGEVLCPGNGDDAGRTDLDRRGVSRRARGPGVEQYAVLGTRRG
jgi:2'-hydroxyisoflavone reductase